MAQERQVQRVIRVAKSHPAAEQQAEEKLRPRPHARQR